MDHEPRGLRVRLVISPTSILPSRDRLTSLPIEIRAHIFKSLHNFSSVLSAASVNKSMYIAYQDFDIRILHTIFRKKCKRKQGVKIGEVFWELVFAIRQDFIARDVAKELFILAWKVFRVRQLEELLYPLGRALAWSYCLDNREDAAIEFLTSLLRGEKPFIRTLGKATPGQEESPTYTFQRSWPLTLLPVIELHQELTESKEGWRDHVGDNVVDFFELQCEGIMYLAEIDSTSLQVFRAESRSFDRLQAQNGIQFCDGKAFLGLITKPPPPIQIQALPQADARKSNRSKRKIAKSYHTNISLW